MDGALAAHPDPAGGDVAVAARRPVREGGAIPTPAVLRGLDLDLPGRKAEYLHAVADAALDGLLDGRTLRAVAPEEAVSWCSR